MLKIFKKGTTTLTSDIETWVVRWNRRHGEFLGEHKEVAQFFTDKDEAEDFADSLRRANKLLGHTCHKLTWVKCERVQNGLDS